MALLQHEELTQTERRLDLPAPGAGLFTEEELAELKKHDALVIDHVSKRFVKSGQQRWLPWHKQAAHGSKIVRAVDEAGIGMRFGDFHSKGLVETLGAT
ncbi:MAG: hypothetical protein ACXVCO_18425, partial [Ktedonobacterales bacterium]